MAVLTFIGKLDKPVFVPDDGGSYATFQDLQDGGLVKLGSRDHDMSKLDITHVYKITATVSQSIRSISSDNGYSNSVSQRLVALDIQDLGPLQSILSTVMNGRRAAESASK